MLDFDLLLSYFSTQKAGFLARGFCTHSPLLAQGYKLPPCCLGYDKHSLVHKSLLVMEKAVCTVNFKGFLNNVHIILWPGCC